MWKNLIKNIKEELRYSDSELATYAGCNPATIWSWENEDRKPRKIYIRNLERELNIRINTEDFTYEKLQTQNLLPVIPETKIGELMLNKMAEVATRYEEIPGTFTKNTFLILIEKDLMLPYIKKGDMVLASMNEEPKDNNVVAVKSTRGSFIGRIHFSKEIVITFDNPEYKPVILNQSEIKEMFLIKKSIRDLE